MNIAESIIYDFIYTIPAFLVWWFCLYVIKNAFFIKFKPVKIALILGAFQLITIIVIGKNNFHKLADHMNTNIFGGITLVLVIGAAIGIIPLIYRKVKRVK